MWPDIFEQTDTLRDAEEPFVLATVVAYKSPQSAKPGSKAVIRRDGTVTGWVGGGCVQPIVLREAMEVLKSGQPKLVSISPDSRHDDWKGVESYQMTCEGGGSLEIYLEPILPKPELLIVGNSPVAQTISELGRILDFKVTLADPDINRDEFPGVYSVLNDLDAVRDQVNERTYVVVATMGNGDEEGLLSVVGTNPRYLGLVAGEKKSRALFDYAREKGVTDEQLARINCPAGIELGGETMSEIALSVMAEITQVRRGSTVEHSPAASHAGPASASLPHAPDETLTEAFDPICGMTVPVLNARYTPVLEGKTYYFCCLRCKETFESQW